MGSTFSAGRQNKICCNHTKGEEIVEYVNWKEASGCQSSSTNLDAYNKSRQKVLQSKYEGSLQRAPKSSGGVGPGLWGITLDQLRLIQSLKGYRQGMNARELVEEVIKPQTAGTGMGYALMINQSAPLYVNHMVSHCWDESFYEFLLALSMAKVQGNLWVCFVAMYQNEDGCGPSISEQLGPSLHTGPFATVLKQTIQDDQWMYAVMTRQANIYTRMWCIYEMYICVQLGIDVDLVISDISLTELCKDPVDCRNARCGDPKKQEISEDERLIRKEIEKMSGSYDAINQSIETLRAIGGVGASFRAIHDGAAVGQHYATDVQKEYAKMMEELEVLRKRLYPHGDCPEDWAPLDMVKRRLTWGRSKQRTSLAI